MAPCNKAKDIPTMVCIGINKRNNKYKFKIIMKRKNLICSLIGMGVVAGSFLTSCSFDEPIRGNNGSMLVKAPEMTAYSGKHTWGTNDGTRGSNDNGNLWYQNWERPVNVTTAEREKVLAAVAEPRVGEKNTVHIDWNNYWVQQVYKGEAEYYQENQYRWEGDNVTPVLDENGNKILKDNATRITGSDQMNHLLAYSSKKSVQTSWYPEAVFELRDKESWESPYEHVDGFNSGNSSTDYVDDETGGHYYGTTLMTDMYAEGVTDQFGYDNSIDSKAHYEYIIIEVDGAYYICFDFYASGSNGGPNKNMDVERDWIFNDWIVKISPAYHKGEMPSGPGETEPGEGENNEICEACGHEAHFGLVCEECTVNDACGALPPDNGTEETPGDGTVSASPYDEVEINLSLSQKSHSLLESHLSVHVRSATNVDVFIPVPARYYCEADDMAIVLAHDEAFIHGGPYETKYVVGDDVVTLTVEFADGGIHIRTSGITQNVIDYCWDTHKDGITFEIWNYYNDPATGLPTLTAEELKEYLDRSTVTFLDKVPKLYVNAFGRDSGKYSLETPEGSDFHVVPEEQSGSFADPVEGPHLNGSTLNELYRNKELSGNN